MPKAAAECNSIAETIFSAVQPAERSHVARD
jgi:hypothetical protein